jgi:excisionase family DNA binding protein
MPNTKKQPQGILPLSQPAGGIGSESVSTGGFFTVLEAARMLNLSRSMVYNLLDSGELTYARFGSSRRIPKAAFEQYCRNSLVTAAK